MLIDSTGPDNVVQETETRMRQTRSALSPYFAFGSNMSRPRLEARVGVVQVVGRVLLHDYEHRFDKLGSDGTAKGNIAPEIDSTVHGVLFELTTGQLEALAKFEGGYRGVVVSVSTAEGEVIAAHTFVAERPGCGVEPSPDYLAHYARGMAQHGLPRSYGRWITRGLAAELLESFEGAWEGAIARVQES